MTHYQLALFAHIVGVLGLFIAISVQWTSLVYMRRARTVAQVREWVGANEPLAKVFPIVVVLILVSGLYMVHELWGTGTAWTTVSLILLIVLSVVGATVTGGRMWAIHAAVEQASEGEVTPTLARRIQDPILWTSLQTSGAVGLGIVYMMTLKPDLGGSLVTVVVALVIGVASAQPMWRTSKAPLPDGTQVAKP